MNEAHNSLTNPSGEVSSVYNRSLWAAFFANVFQLVAVGLLFRYSDFVHFVGGTEFNLGLIVGIATITGVIFRLFLGVAIDRVGPPLIWILSLGCQIIALLWHLKIDSATGVEVFLARGLYAFGVAGNFGAWFSFVSLQAPKERVAEVIGVVGASGFIGMATGPAIGDWIFSSGNVTSKELNLMFQVGAAMVGVSMLFAGMACLLKPNQKTSQESKLKAKGNDNPVGLFELLRIRRPGFILVCGMLTGLVIGFPGTYLRPFAETLGIDEIRTFFITYNATAFTSRMLFRKAPQTMGLRNTISIGFGFFFVSILSYGSIAWTKSFLLPAFIGGLGHSFLFPSIIAACTRQFKAEERGIAMNLILAMYDLGIFFGMPIIGQILISSARFGLPTYPSAFAAICLALLIVPTIYFRSYKEREI